MLICPVCQSPLQVSAKIFRCTHNHSFDIAKEGYVNLHIVQHKKSKNPGDTPQAVQARRAFLSAGHYAPFRTAVADIVHKLQAGVVMDISCGEGYYTQALTAQTQVLGLDIAKSAVQIAAKADKNKRVCWLVGTSSALPVASGSVNVCTSLFSPLPKQEIYRVLDVSGVLLVAVAAPRHLYAVREALFGTVIEHSPDKYLDVLAPEFVLTDRQQITVPMQLDNQSLRQLIAMTPYAYKATAERRAWLERQESFEVAGEFCVMLFKKQ